MVEYKDEGCQFYPSCLQCPYPDCIVDGVPSLLIATKRVEARELAEKGLSDAEIAQRLNVSKKTIQRYLVKIS